jgi:hypothetical protein
MNTTRFSYAAILALGCCLAAGCAGQSGATIPSATSVTPVAETLGEGAAGFLYVSDSGAGDVQFYNWPKPTNPVGTLTGFSEPQGMCNDGKNAYISSTTAASIVEYAAGATKPSRTIVDPDGLPVDCSSDPTSGDLAVANIVSKSYGQGSLEIYGDAKGKPRNITSSDLFKVFAVQYDGSSNLYITGLSADYTPVFAELPAGSKRVKVLCPPFAASGFPGTLGWDGTYIVLGTEDGLYRLKGCKRVGLTPVGGGGPFYIDGNRVVTSDPGNLNVAVYSYPKGRLISTLSGFSQPIGVTIVPSK